MKESKRTDIKTIVAVVIFLIVAVTLVILTFKKVFDFTTAALIFAVTGVIFYFVFVGINYKHSIYGGRFEDHYGKTDKTIKEEKEKAVPPPIKNSVFVGRPCCSLILVAHFLSFWITPQCHPLDRSV